jgi:hypothetical protein
MADTNKCLLISESRGDSNRCIPHRRKSDQHHRYACHASPRTPGVSLLWAVSVHGNLLWVADRVGQSHCSEEKGLLTQSIARLLADPWVCTQFLSRANQWRSGKSQTSVDSKLLGLPDPYHQHAIGTFNTCSWVPIPQYLTDTGGCYNIETSE